MLDYLVDLLLRDLNAQVTGANPLQVQSVVRSFGSEMAAALEAISVAECRSLEHKQEAP